MITHKKIDPKGIPYEKLDEQSKGAYRAMLRADKNVRELYKRHNLDMVVGEKDGKIITRKP